MKTHIFAILAGLFLMAGVADAVPYYYKYTFSNGSFVTGAFHGDESEAFAYLDSSYEFHTFSYREADRRLIFNGFTSFATGEIPLDGSTAGMSFWLNHDTAGSGGDVGFEYHYIGNLVGVYDEKSGKGFFEPVGLGLWELSRSPLSVPDGGGTAAMLCGGLLGMAGVRRLCR